MLLRLLKSRKVILSLILLIGLCIGLFFVTKEPEEIAIIEVEEKSQKQDKAFVFFDVDESKKNIVITQEKTEDKIICEEVKSLPETQIEVSKSQIIPDNVIELKLTGILFDGEESSAIIEIDGNDYWVKNGESIGKFDVIKIEKKRIFLKDNEKDYTLIVGEVVYLSATIIEEVLC